MNHFYSVACYADGTVVLTKLKCWADAQPSHNSETLAALATREPVESIEELEWAEYAEDYDTTFQPEQTS
jgi:hypothetical protein